MENDQKLLTAAWFRNLRDEICGIFEQIEAKYAIAKQLEPGKFVRKPWDREGGGGGEISIMKGNVFEKVGVNISTVFGEFSEEFREHIPGCENEAGFYATGISLVAHMCSPLVPAAHFNTRYIETTKSWFGGGGDLTPMYPDKESADLFHNSFKEACDKHNPDYYPDFKKKCDEYFYLKHRNEARGAGGVFYDYLNTGSFEKDFAFTKDIGRAMAEVYPKIVEAKMNLQWSKEQRDFQLIRRGRYVEFNLLYDRGTTFGLMTGGNVEGILMSLPPVVCWP